MKPDTSTNPELTPQERLVESRSKIESLMQNETHLLHVLKPVVESYAKTYPIKTLVMAAAAGAAVVVFKPWRLITIRSLLAVLKARL